MRDLLGVVKQICVPARNAYVAGVVHCTYIIYRFSVRRFVNVIIVEQLIVRPLRSSRTTIAFVQFTVYLIDSVSAVCSSKRLSHACIKFNFGETANGSLEQVSFSSDFPIG